MSYTKQSTLYKTYADSYALPVIYIATGNLPSARTFAKTTSPTPVVTKTDLLSEAELALLNSLSWDQQAQVDYLVLLRATRFLGMSDSNFSWAVAVARRAVEEGTCVGIERGLGADGTVAMRDELSVVVGKKSKYDFGTRSWP
jgi:hypothetical protein